MKNFYLIANEQKQASDYHVQEIMNYLISKDMNCSMLIRQNNQPCDVPQDTDCILVLGGDGTLLQVARETVHLNIPLLGINLGTLGYMAEVEISNLYQALDALITDQYFTEKRMMLKGVLCMGGELCEQTHALNDIVITRQGVLKVIVYEIYVNGIFLNRYVADGIIIATPTGSTGYNMSAGGPIVEPKASLIVITPICPHTLNTRSIILAPDDEIEIRVLEGRDGKMQEMEVYFDGNQNEKVVTGDHITISKSEKETIFIRLNEVSFLEVLNRKMSEN